MKKKRTTLLVGIPGVAVFSVLLIAGCTGENTNQALVASNPHSEWLAGSIPVELADGTMTTMSKIGFPFYLVAFVEAPVGEPCFLSPEVKQIAQKVWLDSVNVIQVTLPSGNASNDVLKTCPIPQKNVVRVFDPDGITWNRFRRPQAGTLLLVDPNGQIASTGTLSKPEEVLFDTHRMSNEWDRENNPTTNLPR